MSDLTDLEARVMEQMLSDNTLCNIELRTQLSILRVMERSYTGVGFLTVFELPGDLQPRNSASFEISDIAGSSPSISRGISFILFVREGRLQMLEAATYDEPWPNKESEIVLNRIVVHKNY